jgi:hypothetical protein
LVVLEAEQGGGGGDGRYINVVGNPVQGTGNEGAIHIGWER